MNPTTTATSTVNPAVRAGLDAADRGWHIFPTVPGGKRPAIRAWETAATTDPDRITRFWTIRPAYGIGLACGPSGLLVLDLDQPKPGKPVPTEHAAAGIACGHDTLAAVCEDAGQPWPPATFTVTTPSGGTHLYYRQPPGHQLRNTQGEHGGLGWLVDTRGHGGYVIAPGTHLEHGSYTVLDDTPAADLPAWLAGRLTATSPRQPASATVELRSARLGTYVATAIDTQTAHVRRAAEGRRNFTLYMAAQNLGQLIAGGMVEESVVHHALLTAAESHIAVSAYTRNEAVNTIRSGIRAGAKRPRSLTHQGAA